MSATSTCARRSHGAARRRAFTLIEILIVLTVIGILAALLFPAFSRVKDSARTTSCANNLHQLGLVMEMYSADNNGFYPSPIDPRPQPPEVRCSWVNRIESYLKSPEVLKCPAYPQGDFVSGCPSDEIIGEERYSHHGSYSLGMLSPNGGSRSIRAASLNHPSSTVLLLDGRNSRFDFPTWPNPNVVDLIAEGIVPRHKGEGINVLFVDGHTKWRRLDSLLDKNLWLPYGGG